MPLQQNTLENVEIELQFPHTEFQPKVMLLDFYMLCFQYWKSVNQVTDQLLYHTSLYRNSNLFVPGFFQLEKYQIEKFHGVY